MALRSFFTIGGKNNNSGFYDFAFIVDSDVLFMPDPVNGIIDFSQVILKDERIFLSGYASLNTLSLGDESRLTSQGANCPCELSGRTPVVDNNNLHLFSNMVEYRYVLLCQDNNNNWFVMGEPNNGLFFSFKRNDSFLDFKFSATYNHICWQASGDVIVDGSIIETGTGNNSNGTQGGVVNIKNSSGESIASITAPADYNVADSTITLKNSGGTTVGTDTVKAASSKNVNVPDAIIEVEDTDGGTLFSTNKLAGVTSFVVAPDATMTVNSVPFTTLKSGETKNYTLTDQNGNPIIANVVGTSVTIVMPDNSFFNYCNGNN